MTLFSTVRFTINKLPFFFDIGEVSKIISLKLLSLMILSFKLFRNNWSHNDISLIKKLLYKYPNYFFR